MKYSQEKIEESRAYLLKFLKPGTTVLTVLRNVSRSGMSRRIDLYTINKGEPVWLSHAAAVVMVNPRPTDVIRVSGCGIDMGFHLVYSLSARLWPKGTAKPHGTRNGEPDSTGGYALKQRWL